MSTQIKAIRTVTEEVSEPSEMMDFAQKFLVELAGRAYAEANQTDYRGQENAKIADRARKALRLLRGESRESVETEVQAPSVKGKL